MTDMSTLLDIMRTLRDPVHGCPWDRAQDYRSIVPHTLEEAYEVAQAIEDDDFDALPDELGDLLFQVVFYCQLASEQGRFDFAVVARTIADKLVRRHPHVFAAAEGRDVERVVADWEAGKAAERRARAGARVASELDDVPLALPALSRAAKVQKRAARVGFDWPDASGARAKLDEELVELDHATSGGDRTAVADELGDVLFTVVNLARHHGIEPEAALRHATAKFERRFRGVEAAFGHDPTALGAASAAALEAAWAAVKGAEKKSGRRRRP